MEWLLSLALIILQIFRIAVPYLLTSVGATFSERGGVINLGLEGMILFGAFGATVGQYLTGSAYLGLLFAMVLGFLAALLHALMSVTLKANQILSGVALNILAIGLTQFFLSAIFQSSSNSARIEGFGQISIIENPIFIFTLLLVPFAQVLLFQTAFGLRLRATGESAETVDALGVSPSRMRYSGVLISGVLAALAGAYLAYEQHSFTDGMSAGRGYISLAAMIIGKWNPFGAALASLLFAGAETLELNLQSDAIPTQLVQALPYVVTLLVLVGFIGKSEPPKEIGTPYEK